MPSWTFSALGFTVLWRAVGRDVLPYPVQFRSTAETTDDFENQWKTEAGNLARLAENDDDLESAIRILRGPEARIEMSGFAGAATSSGDLSQMGDPACRVRALAAVHRRYCSPSNPPEARNPVGRCGFR